MPSKERDRTQIPASHNCYALNDSSQGTCKSTSITGGDALPLPRVDSLGLFSDRTPYSPPVTL